jgi:hypothetical protein
MCRVQNVPGLSPLLLGQFVREAAVIVRAVTERLVAGLSTAAKIDGFARSGLEFHFLPVLIMQCKRADDLDGTIVEYGNFGFTSALCHIFRSLSRGMILFSPTFHARHHISSLKQPECLFPL